MPHNLSNPFTWTRMYAKTYYNSRTYRDLFTGIRTYCMFLGYPRSGHSLVGSLLDAHPDVIIAHELDVLKYVHAGFSRDQIFYLLLENSKRLAARGRGYSGYSYQVPRHWQGRVARLPLHRGEKEDRCHDPLPSNTELLHSLDTTNLI